jgi:hypothetical protein
MYGFQQQEKAKPIRVRTIVEVEQRLGESAARKSQKDSQGTAETLSRQIHNGF